MSANPLPATNIDCTMNNDPHDGGLCPLVGGDIGWLSPEDLGDGTTETVCPGMCGAWIVQDNATGEIIHRQRQVTRIRVRKRPG
jgi:hypothetical protein